MDTFGFRSRPPYVCLILVDKYVTLTRCPKIVRYHRHFYFYNLKTHNLCYVFSLVQTLTHTMLSSS